MLVFAASSPPRASECKVVVVVVVVVSPLNTATFIMQHFILYVSHATHLCSFALSVPPVHRPLAPGGRSGGRRLAWGRSGAARPAGGGRQEAEGSLTMLIVHDHVVTIRRTASCLPVRAAGSSRRRHTPPVSCAALRLALPNTMPYVTTLTH
ncbi:hypothetical protein E2C01_081011 [Portunus trituberculatus]|uniref:Uncharacterized protein n=1 Tax=Portunus trituberculatus TaxID=210409 RepID=A0A5B7IUP6_PORTR|nr:hypothetical protein [Portunus trituberculatus]